MSPRPVQRRSPDKRDKAGSAAMVEAPPAKRSNPNLMLLAQAGNTSMRARKSVKFNEAGGEKAGHVVIGEEVETGPCNRSEFKVRGGERLMMTGELGGVNTRGGD